MTALPYSSVSFSAHENKNKCRSAAMSCRTLDLPERWATWLARTSPEIIDRLGASERTKRHWLNQIGEPRARYLARAMSLDPGSIPYLIGETDDLPREVAT